MPLIVGSRIKAPVDKRIEGDEATVQKIGKEIGTYKDYLEHAIHINAKRSTIAIMYNKWPHWHDWLKEGLEPSVYTAKKHIAAPATCVSGRKRILGLKSKQIASR